MTKINIPDQQNFGQRIVDEYIEEDLGLPYPITLKGCVTETYDLETGESISCKIPKMEQLLSVVAIVRCYVANKLSGQEIKFIRGILNISAKDLAGRMGVAVSTWSRWENGKQTMGEPQERLLRLFAHESLKNNAPGLDMLDALTLSQMGLRAVREEGDYPRLIFCAGLRNEDMWNGQELEAA